MKGKKIDLDEVMGKLREARKHGYAGGGVYNQLVSGEKIFRYGSRTGYLYEDRYVKLFSPETFAGEEILFHHDAYLWHMVYAGGMQYPYTLDKGFTEEVFRFLKTCLCASLKIAPRAYPFLPRGPITQASAKTVRFKSKYGFLHYSYLSDTFDCGKFDGRESIFWIMPKSRPQEVFIHLVQGGLFV